MAVDTDRIHKPIRKLRKFLKLSPKRLTPEEIHELRTNARRFETNVEALGLSHDKNEKRLSRKLARVRKRAGKIRDMDVLTEYALTVNLDGEQDCLVQLLESLGANRAKHVKKLRDEIARVGTSLRRRLKRSATKLQKAFDKIRRRQTSSAAHESSEPMAQALRLSQQLKRPERLDKKNLHEYRLKIKELRYILQLAEDADQQQFVSKLGEVQDAIGEWHDWQELISIAGQTLDHSGCKLLIKLQAIAETKYDQALSLTNKVRRAYLGSTGR